MRHRVYVDVHVAVPGRLEDLWQGRPARSRGEDDVGVGDRRVAHPFPVDVPPLASEAGEEHDDRAVDAGRATVKVRDRKSTRLNSSHGYISYAVFCLKKKKRLPV